MTHDPKTCQYYKEPNRCSYYEEDCRPSSIQCHSAYKKRGTIVINNPTLKPTRSKSSSVNRHVIPQNIVKTVDLADGNCPIINLYRGFLTIPEHYLEDHILMIRDVFNKHKFSVYAIYNTNNMAYYMSKTEFDLYVKEGHVPLVKTLFTNECTNPIQYGDFREFSILALYGYRVGKTNGLSSGKRHSLLRILMDNEIVTGHSVISLLQGNIALRESQSYVDFRQAISDWREDIEFVRDYMFEKHGIARSMLDLCK